MNSIDKEKYAKVISWLELQYESKENIPKFEVTNQTIQILYEIAVKNEKRNRQAELIKQDWEQKTEFYQNEAKRIDNILESVGFSERHYSQQETLHNALKTIATISTSMELADVELTSMMISLSDLMLESSNLSTQKAEEKKLSDDLQVKIHSAINKLNELQKLITELYEANEAQKKTTESRVKNIQYFESKSLEYETTIEGLKSTFEASNMSPELYHRSLVKLHEEFVRLQKSIDSKLSTLKTYHDLPPDISLARVKIEEARAQLNKLDGQLSSSITQFI